jgi:hypothetical protein
VSWANLDDRLHAHPKVQELQAIPVEGIMAFGLWAWALSWCRAYSPDTGITTVKAAARAWNADPEMVRQLVDLLVDVGLAERDERDSPTWAIHDWVDWQMTQQVRAGRARAEGAVRGNNGRFVTSALDPLVSAGRSGGSPPGHASPRHSTPRLSPLVDGQRDEPGLSTFHETARRLGYGSPSPRNGDKVT